MNSRRLGNRCEPIRGSLSEQPYLRYLIKFHHLSNFCRASNNKIALTKCQATTLERGLRQPQHLDPATSLSISSLPYLYVPSVEIAVVLGMMTSRSSYKIQNTKCSAATAQPTRFESLSWKATGLKTEPLDTIMNDTGRDDGGDVGARLLSLP